MINEVAIGFNAVQNNTSLKQQRQEATQPTSFNAVQNNTSLKLYESLSNTAYRFNAVQNNTSLKLSMERFIL